jgi:hypothetical protein
MRRKLEENMVTKKTHFFLKIHNNTRIGWLFWSSAGVGDEQSRND